MPGLLSRRRRPERPVVRPTFRDDATQASFARDGYVVADLLDAGAVAELLGTVAGLDHRFDDTLPYVEGFHTTLYDRRVDYRSAVYDAVVTALRPGLDRLLVDHVLHVANVQRKAAGAHILPAHLDWTWVDETTNAAVTVWCSLVDVSEDNGAIAVHPGTHREVPFLRAVNHRFYDVHAALGRDVEPTTVDLRAGQAVIFDTRLLHFSHPNRTGGPRYAATCVAVPAAGPTFHYWFDDGGLPHRLEVEPRFWLHYRIDQDPRTVPGCVRSDIVTDEVFA